MAHIIQFAHQERVRQHRIVIGPLKLFPFTVTRFKRVEVRIPQDGPPLYYAPAFRAFLNSAFEGVTDLSMAREPTPYEQAMLTVERFRREGQL